MVTHASKGQLFRLRQKDHLSPRVGVQPGQHREILSIKFNLIYE
jgi:hypothetical protein